MMVKTVKAGGQLLTIARHCIAARLPLLLVGKHGVGKSQILEQAAAGMGIGYVCRDLSLMEPPDLVGLPRAEGNVTRYLPPAFLPTEGKGLLVFEELNRCPTYMRTPCLQLLTARTLNDYRLPDGWSVAAAVNPPDASYEVNELDPAILSRFVRVEVVADRKEWLLWADDAGVHEVVRDFVARDPQSLSTDEASPRAWKMVSDLVSAEGFEDLKESDQKVMLAGVIGRALAEPFCGFRKKGETTLYAPEVLANWPDARKDIRGSTLNRLRSAAWNGYREVIRSTASITRPCARRALACSSMLTASSSSSRAGRRPRACRRRPRRGDPAGPRRGPRGVPSTPAPARHSPTHPSPRATARAP